MLDLQRVRARTEGNHSSQSFPSSLFFRADSPALGSIGTALRPSDILGSADEVDEEDSVRGIDAPDVPRADLDSNGEERGLDDGALAAGEEFRR